ncbi:MULTISPECIES: exonuclease domain-containing protein [unclassified Dietzia]|uniref:exonuclease domain-containing protein n=1 Tax=unclassified Dietzia TaxID=2617939 RepID=UPI000D20CF12|nr:MULTISPECIES: exonuclease domain-containing protein [unclassified Dietzia]AVZ39654.1 DNA polymerase III subunit epsilon [Dietzia sp. JS16-p6b]MBB1025888.1 DNA polymerase III subunit epsilon [Dietzia sp. DQ12-76]MBB1027912.1 DNA polymerase III subunit epsilon [Dietzia sp. DQ11-38-2]QGW24966.1 DNA polymerase III subunit epsilon [Dietzia sp. DQ12-45-1b]
MRDWFTRSGRRQRAARRLPDGPLRRYLETPPPAPSTPLADLRLLAVDVETTGLDPRRHRVLSVGLVPVDGDRIDLGGARSMILRDDHADEVEGVGQSATLHGITDDAVANGVGVDVVLDQVFSALTGRVLVAHYSHIETEFLDSLCSSAHDVRPPLVSVDTLDLHRRVLGGGVDMGFAPQSSPDELRLWNARQRYGLPRYRAHDALIDALACAELYLAQTAELRDRGVTTLRDLRTA